VRKLHIQSKLKPYSVDFNSFLLNNDLFYLLGTHFVIDKNVYELYETQFSKLDNVIIIEATEEHKTYEYVSTIIQSLHDKQLKRNSILVAIGGGIIQDICCFISSIWMRGIKWVFIPTTLLAQADSCIGSKSSINFGNVKNLLGTFNSPDKIFIDFNFIHTLSQQEIDSGVGEILKLYIISNSRINMIDISSDLPLAVIKALSIKKGFIEEDEFDQGIRNILNYGHCFGHAIESCSNFTIPHGVAVCIGMDIVNNYSCASGLVSLERYEYYHKLLSSIYLKYVSTPIQYPDIISCIKNDKKNSVDTINLILPVKNEIVKRQFDNTQEFWDTCKQSFEEIYNESLRLHSTNIS
jgi:3-dehydroquinate synthase